MSATVLIVDDEMMIRNVFEAALRREGYNCLTAENGLEGLKAFTERQHTIQVIVWDVVMPVMNGIQMVSAILEDVEPHPCVIMISGSSEVQIIPSEIRERCIMLQKPFNLKVLLDTVKACVSGTCA